MITKISITILLLNVDYYMKKQLNTAITKKGYRLDKSEFNKKKLNELKESLTVVPHSGTDNAGEPYEVFLEEKKYIYIPKFFGINSFGKPQKLFGQKKTKVKMKFNGNLRPIQKPVSDKCIKHLKKNGGGILSLPCGFGKTILSLYVACQLKVKTLVIVHKTFLQDQWIDKIKQFTNAKIGTIRQKKVDVEGKDIIIGMLQSISMRDYDKEVFKDISLVIVDEAHHIAAKVFCRALRKVSCKYILGLSATIERKDKLTKILYWYMGDIIHKTERKPNNKVCVRVFNYTSDDPSFTKKSRWIKGKVRPDTIKMTGNVCILKDRNVFLLKILNTLINIKSRKVLFLSHRIGHLRLLKAALDKVIQNKENDGGLEKGEYFTDYYIGGMKKDALKKAETADVIFGSVNMAEEGLDIPDLNTIILASPKKDIVQAVGRILRKTMKDMLEMPLIIDIRDELCVFDRWGSLRNNYYKRNKYNIETHDVFNSSIGEQDCSDSESFPELEDVLNMENINIDKLQNMSNNPDCNEDKDLNKPNFNKFASKSLPKGIKI